MRRILLPTTLLALLATLTIATPAQAAADCNVTQWYIAFNQTYQTTHWDANCNTAWNLTLVLQYKDSAGWHNAGCGSSDCKRDKPSDGSWFTADSTHGSNDTWNLTRPADPCAHPIRLRFNFHFFSGAGGITFNNAVDNNPCTTAP
jgi:opacity protein-like surface antigen